VNDEKYIGLTKYHAPEHNCRKQAISLIEGVLSVIGILRQSRMNALNVLRRFRSRSLPDRESENNGCLADHARLLRPQSHVRPVHL